MAIKVTSSYASAKAHFQVRDEGAVKLYDDYAYTGKKIQPFAATAEWKLRDGAWTLYRVSVSGMVLKADGSAGKTNTHREAYRYDEWSSDAPQWLKDAVEHAAPQTEWKS
jgi:hypothetical protein